ncbi:MAG TPA: class I SAM-dependent methyltransferase [Solirubrobacterales bacterium]|jgi:SAM-dependent methyltransferase|nr:class I SAM-dependent methyltransferase [Solirubrobacterales bacterium]
MPDEAREPTSHERRAGQWWDESYRDQTAPWDIGRPQAAFERLAAAGRWRGAVLDSGCGSGEHALRAAELGLSVLGVDVAETAIAMAREKAAARGLDAEFELADALHLERLGRTFDTVLDCGLLHTFDAEERPAYLASLAAVTEPGATLFCLCFREGAPETEGPHPVSEADLRAALSPEAGWDLTGLEESEIEVTLGAGQFPAWLLTASRVG